MYLTQKEIKATMTQGVWEANSATYSFTEYSHLPKARGIDIGIIKKAGEYGEMELITGIIPPNDSMYTNTTNKDLETSEANACAIVTAVNATYGNGILPSEIDGIGKEIKKLRDENTLLKQRLATIKEAASIS